MSFLRLTVAFVAIFGLAGCGSEPETVMPDVMDRQLDVALEDIESAGVSKDPEVVGGGTFGIVDESKWRVCDQSPAAGEAVTAAPELTVDRSCGDEEDGKQQEEESQPVTTSTEPAPATTEKPAEEPATVPDVPVVDAPEETLTVENNTDLAALLVVPDHCDDSIAGFAAMNQGRTIAFDGNIAALTNHEGANTRYDILLSPGDFSETSQTGPSFQFRDVGISDLGLTGSNTPDAIGEGANLLITADVGEFNSDQCLFLIDPVSTVVR